MEAGEILGKFEFYRTADSRMRSAVQENAAMATLSAGDFYFHEGDVCSHIALVGQGSIRVFKCGESGREITLYHVMAGQTCILTAACVLANKHYPASARAESDTEAVLFPANVFRDWVATNDLLRRFVFETLAERMADVMTLIEEVTFSKMDKRLAAYLLQRFTHDGMAVRVINETHENIAAELGTAREVVSRLLKDFERRRAIELGRGRIILQDEKLLLRMS